MSHAAARLCCVKETTVQQFWMMLHDIENERNDDERISSYFRQMLNAFNWNGINVIFSVCTYVLEDTHFKIAI